MRIPHVRLHEIYPDFRRFAHMNRISVLHRNLRKYLDCTYGIERRCKQDGCNYHIVALKSSGRSRLNIARESAHLTKFHTPIV